MSPTGTSFKFQVAQFQGELTRCIEFCQDIRANRHLDGTKNLDNLENALESAEISIPNNFNEFRRLVGSRMETGDDRARREMSEHILDVQSKIKSHLREIAQPQRHRERHERQKAGFKDLLREWEGIFKDVSSTMRSLSSRIDNASRTPAPESKPEPKKRNTDDVTISLKELDHLMEHMRNSWEEVIIGGALVYVNALDRKRTMRERPENAYIKSAPRSGKTSRTPSWDQPKKTKVPSWERNDW